MPFFQDGPTLGNQLQDDAPLRELLERKLPPEVLREVTPGLHTLGALAGGPLYEAALQARGEEPRLVPFDAWGRRVDRIEVPALWTSLARVAVEHGLVATAHERRHGEHSRVHQMALVYLFAPSSSLYSCPLAMTDGAAVTLRTHANRALCERALSRLLSRDPERAWTSGQWMTERTGGSDVGLSETVARPDAAQPGTFLLSGTKWFTSAATADMTLTLARPEGNGPGGKGLALFYLELRRPDGSLNGLQVLRLKEKLGTRMLPTAELELDGARAIPVAGLSDGVRAVAPMLQITRTWNAVCAVASMRRGLALATDYARRRVAFGAPLADKPLHAETLADLAARFEASLLLAFRAVELLGRAEAGTATGAEALQLRLLQPLAKLFTAREAVASASEVLEAFGGAGYIEDTGLPTLLRDAQVLPIWEGTTNVLALDVLRVLGPSIAAEGPGGALSALLEDAVARASAARAPQLAGARACVLSAAERLAAWASLAAGAAREAGARAFSLALSRTVALALVLDHAQWLSLAGETRSAGAARAMGVARRLGREPICPGSWPGAAEET